MAVTVSVAGDAAGGGTSVFRGGSSFPSVARRASAGPQRKEIAESVSERILCRFPNGPVGPASGPERSVARLLSTGMSFHGLLDRDLYRNLDLHLVRVVRRSRDLRRSRLAGLPGVIGISRSGFPVRKLVRRGGGTSDRIGIGCSACDCAYRMYEFRMRAFDTSKICHLSVQYASSANTRRSAPPYFPGGMAGARDDFSSVSSSRRFADGYCTKHFG